MLIFDNDKLKQLSILKENIDFFVLHDFSTIDDSSKWETSLHNYPIIKIDNCYIVIPDYLGFAIRKFILREIEKINSMEEYSVILFHQQSHKAFLYIHEPIFDEVKFPTIENSTIRIAYQLYKIDIDKIAYVIFISDMLEGKADKDWSSMEVFSNTLIDYLVHNCKQLTNTWQKGIIILISGNIGGGLLLSRSNTLAKYKFSSFSLYDFELLMNHKDFSLLKLWKCICQYDEIIKNGTKIVNASGDINLFAFWFKNGYQLIPYNTGKKEKYDVITIPTDMLLDIRKYVKLIKNFHSVKYNDDKYLVVQRKDINSYFPSYNYNNIYFAIHLLFSRIFILLIEASNYKIWIHLNKNEGLNENTSSLLFEICNLILFWLDKGVNEIESLLANKEPNIFHINVTFSGFEAYPFKDINDIPDKNIPFDIEYTLDGDIELIIDVSILKKMSIPENIAEKELIASLMGVMYFIVNHGVKCDDSSIIRIVNKIFKYKKFSRQLHMFTNADKDSLLLVNKNKLILSPIEDIRFVEDGLDFSISNLDKDSIILLLKNFVDILYNDIVVQLVKFNRKSTVIKAMENNDNIRIEANRWRKTSAAIISSHNDESEAFEIIKDQLSIFAKNSQVSRALAEIALCHCTDNGKEISITEFERLLAIVYKILEFGRVVDSLHYDLIGIDTFGIDSGLLYFNNSAAIDSIMEKYQNSIVYQDIGYSIDAYPDIYKENDKKKTNNNNIRQFNHFKEIFRDDFEFNCELIYEIPYIILNHIIENNISYLEVSFCELSDIIIKNSKSNITIDELEKYVDYFSINIRSQFQEPKESPYYKNNHIWLYKRPLSLLLKPFIRISVNEYLIFPKLLSEASEYYFLACFNGELDHKFFNKKMLTYFGHRRNLIGQKFNDMIAKWFSDKGYETRSNIMMTALGVKGDQNNLGDIDVIAFEKGNNYLFIIECKNLEKAKTAKEIGQQIERFLKGSERWLSRHIFRYKWIVDNKSNAQKILKIGNVHTRVIPILLVNDIIPLQFMNTLDYPIENIITISQLDEGFLHEVKLDYYPIL